MLKGYRTELISSEMRVWIATQMRTGMVAFIAIQLQPYFFKVS